MTARLVCVSLALLSFGLSAACDNKGSAAPRAEPAASTTTEVKEVAAPAPDALKKEAAEIFAGRCTVCHGPTGAGDGPASKGLTPPPRNLRDPSWQGSVTDSHIENIIMYGGAAVGRSPAMPPNPDLADKPVVKALREHVRNLKQ